MKSKHFVFFLSIIFSIGFVISAQAQAEKPKDRTSGTSGIMENHSYAWIEASDRWNYQKEFIYLLDGPASTLTPKGGAEDQEKFATRGPVLNRYCFGVENPAQCTREYIQSNLGNIYHPSIIYPVGYSGTEYVVFDLDANGRIAGGYHVVQQGTVCEPCSQAAVNAVAKLEKDWSPAIQNGNAAKSTVVVPVGFHVTAPLPEEK
ncbi:MAG: hypothetical protein H6577_00685 [Lewinellaceae bacterium]|nr:hypothetical protein [Saprospiraceae bacterium]MCB9336623.1 hypothetical protein [Lewinellaceae bacterium]